MGKELIAVRTGVDIIEVERVARAHPRRPQLLRRIFYGAGTRTAGRTCL